MSRIDVHPHGPVDGALRPGESPTPPAYDEVRNGSPWEDGERLSNLSHAPTCIYPPGEWGRPAIRTVHTVYQRQNHTVATVEAGQCGCGSVVRRLLSVEPAPPEPPKPPPVDLSPRSVPIPLGSS